MSMTSDRVVSSMNNEISSSSGLSAWGDYMWKIINVDNKWIGPILLP
jgi:hypothetical protein